MNSIVLYKDKFDKLLYPMIDILNNKNITAGISYITEDNKIYICFDKEYLSETNKLILEKISVVYCETLFYSDNMLSPNSDRLEYWSPDECYEKETKIKEKCNNKKYFVLVLDEKDKFTILGTTIMLANSLQEQDPLQLACNKGKTIYSADEMQRHDHYISNGYQDTAWISLNIFLNKDNPLNENPYAHFMLLCEINSPVKCDNMLGTIMVGYEVKKTIYFNMDQEELLNVIKGYYGTDIDIEELIALNEKAKKLLLKKANN